MLFPDNFNPDLYALDFSIDSVMLFDPERKPKVPKPLESDIQDAKLLYYHPADRHIEAKRNFVGLIEGTVTFFSPFSPKKKQQKATLINLDNHSYIAKNFEESLWLCIGINNLSKSISYRSNPTSGTYLNEGVFQNEKSNINLSLAEQFLDHFVDMLTLFYGKVSSYVDENGVTELFPIIFEDFIQQYKKLNSKPDSQLNLFKYQTRVLNYAPIEKRSFLAIHHLMSVVSSVELNLRHFCFFYNGYYIYSTFDHHTTQLIYDYLYVNSNVTEIDLYKTDRFSRMNMMLSYGHCNYLKGEGGFLYGLVEDFTGDENSQASNNYGNEGIISDRMKKINESFELYTPNIWLKEDGNNMKNYKLSIYNIAGVTIVMAFDNEKELTSEKLQQLKANVNKNLGKLSNNLSKQVEKLYSKEETSRMSYYNTVSFSYRTSYSFLKHIDNITYRLILETVQGFISREDKESQQLMTVLKSGKSWVLVKYFNGRVVVHCLSSQMTIQKVEEEKVRLLESFSSNILL